MVLSIYPIASSLPLHLTTAIAASSSSLPTSGCSTAARCRPSPPASASSSPHHRILRRVFDMLDADADGHVSAEDVARHLWKLGLAAEDALAAASVVPCQCSAPALLDFDDFVRFYEDGDEELAEAFALYDVDGDGFICCEELQQVLAGMGFTNCHDPHFCRLILQSADTNSDGKIDFPEFRQMMARQDL